MSIRGRLARFLGAHEGRPLRRGVTAAVVVVLLGVGAGATYATWSASVTATSTASAAQLAITSANFTSNAYTFGNEALTTTGSVTVTNTTSTPSTRVPALALAFSRASGSAVLAGEVGLTVWYQANGSCTAGTGVGPGAVTGTWASFPGISSTLAKAASATYCVRSTIADRQDVAVAGGTLTFLPQVVGTLSVGNFTGTATATAGAGQTTRQIYPLSSISPASWFMVKRATTNLCMDVSGAATGPGGAIISYTCKTSAEGYTNQEWQFLPAGSTGYYEIKPHHAATVRLDATGSTSGTPLTTQTRTGGDAQLWQPQLASAGVYQFVNKLTGLCLTAGGSSNTPMTQATCDGGAAQRHTLTSTTSTVVPLANLTCSTNWTTATFSWTSASNGGYTIWAERVSGDWREVSATTATTASSATITGTLPAGTPMLNWSTGGHAIRITDGSGAIVGNDTVTIGSFGSYRYFTC